MNALTCSLIAVAAVVAGCATPDPAPPESARAIAVVAAAATPAKGSVLRSAAVDGALENRILALDPNHVSEADVATTLSKAPAPHIMLIHGGVYPVHLMMESTGKFLVKMGYPEDRIRDPGKDRRWSYSPYEDSAHLAGLLAWYYEHEGVRPMMIGHSQGGIQAVKVLYELAGKFSDSVRVFDPYKDVAIDRTTIVDPLTGAQRPVVGTELCYASTIGAGGMTLLLPNQWSMLDKMYAIPDTVEDYTGFVLDFDPIGWRGTFSPTGKATVRNVELPLSYNHLTTPYVSPLADDKAIRDWIAAYAPGQAASKPPGESAGYATVWAADVWYSIKKHWTLEAQRLIRARRTAIGQS